MLDTNPPNQKKNATSHYGCVQLAQGGCSCFFRSLHGSRIRPEKCWSKAIPGWIWRWHAVAYKHGSNKGESMVRVTHVLMLALGSWKTWTNLLHDATECYVSCLQFDRCRCFRKNRMYIRMLLEPVGKIWWGSKIFAGLVPRLKQLAWLCCSDSVIFTWCDALNIIPAININ